MSKIKKIFAVLLTLAMVMGMSLTTYAEPKETAEIKVTGADEATLTYVQIIKPDQTKATGWDFCSVDIAKAYTDAFADTDAQSVLQTMITGLAENADYGKTAEIAKALSNLGGNTNIVFGEMANPQEVTSAGVYAIHAVEEGYTYNNMAAYVGFGAVDNHEYPSLLDTELTAKKAPATVVKDNNDTDDVVAVGDTVVYTVTAYVPYINPNDDDRTFFVYDNITGAAYNLEDAAVTMGDETVEAEITPNQEKTGFSIDLSDLIDDANSNAGKKITVTYKATVIAESIKNTATAGHTSGNQFGSAETAAYTGKITLTKNGENTQTVLAGAGFKVTKGEDTTALTFTEESKGVYMYSPAGNVTEVFTGEDGKLCVKGLDVGKYHFEETTAPEGYSINADGADAELKVTGGSTATAILEAETSLLNTKLSALPETGGIGTTIFTIGGCLIMIIAAALFFASRRKSQK